MSERRIRHEIMVQASPQEVWDAWTTPEGIRSFFAPACRMVLEVDGPYEIHFFPDAPPGARGAEGTRILAYQAPRMLSFTWDAPPHLPAVRAQRTHVTVRIEAGDDGRSRVALTHDGWGEGGEWDEAFAYFDRAWGETVLPRLRQRFADGPIAW